MQNHLSELLLPWEVPCEVRTRKTEASVWFLCDKSFFVTKVIVYVHQGSFCRPRSSGSPVCDLQFPFQPSGQEALPRVLCRGQVLQLDLPDLCFKEAGFDLTRGRTVEYTECPGSRGTAMGDLTACHQTWRSCTLKCCRSHLF